VWQTNTCSPSECSGTRAAAGSFRQVPCVLPRPRDQVQSASGRTRMVTSRTVLEAVSPRIARLLPAERW
jgi:hypothetical protein